MMLVIGFLAGVALTALVAFIWFGQHKATTQQENSVSAESATTESVASVEFGTSESTTSEEPETPESATASNENLES